MFLKSPYTKDCIAASEIRRFWKDIKVETVISQLFNSAISSRVDTKYYCIYLDLKDGSTYFFYKSEDQEERDVVYKQLCAHLTVIEF